MRSRLESTSGASAGHKLKSTRPSDGIWIIGTLRAELSLQAPFRIQNELLTVAYEKENYDGSSLSEKPCFVPRLRKLELLHRDLLKCSFVLAENLFAAEFWVQELDNFLFVKASGP